MKKGWIILLIFGVLLLAGAAVVIVSLFGLFLSVEPVIPERAVLVIDLEGEIPDYAEPSVVEGMFGTVPLTFESIVQALDKAAVDPRVQGAWIRVNRPAIGWAKVTELQKHLDRFKGRGKMVIATILSAAERDYACALPADAIYISPEGSFEFNGFSMTSMFLKDMFTKVGIKPEVARFGEYKSAGDMLDRSSMSEFEREAAQSLLDEINGRFIQMVTAWRKKLAPEKVQALMEEGIFNAQGAAAAGLVDGLKYDDEVEELFVARLGKHAKKFPGVSVRAYRKVSWESLGVEPGPTVAVIHVSDFIGHGPDGYSPIFGRVTGSDRIRAAFKQVRENPEVKAVILRVDSPGGEVLASDLMWREAAITDKVKPVIASMSDYAASGGYYISSGCRKIVAEPLTITGSIGVVASFFNLAELFNEKLGIRFETVKKGPCSDVMNPYRPMTDEEKQRFLQEVKASYDRFVNKVAQCRKKSAADVDKVAQGRVWTGSQAQAAGLVDEMGGMDKAAEIALREARLPTDKPARLVTYPPARSFWDLFYDALGQGAIAPASSGAGVIARELKFLGRFVLPSSRSALAVMPFGLIID